MTVTNFQASLGGYIDGYASSYATAVAGANLSTATNETTCDVNHTKAGDNWFYLIQYFLDFDTSVIGAYVISEAYLKLQLTSNMTASQSHAVQARLFDWSTTLTTADWRTAANLSGYTLLCHCDITSATAAGNKTFTDDALAANINKAGHTRIVLCTDRWVAGTAPTTIEQTRWAALPHATTAYRPVLSVTYAPAAATFTPRIILL